MSILRRILPAAVFLALAASGFAATPTTHEVLRAINVLEKNVTGPEAAEAARTIVAYAQESDEVMVDIGAEQLPWVSEKWGLDEDRELTCQSMLLASFVAGNIRSQIKNSRVEDDTYSGWIFAIGTYNRLREKGAFRSPSIDSLSKMESEGTLLRHAKEIQSKEDKDDAPDVPKTPLAFSAWKPSLA
jgi:hypothetical protein